jgi:flavoprotein
VPKLSLVVCGAPLAARAQEVARAATDAGWAVDIQVTAAARAWLPELAEATLRRPEDPKPSRPDAVVVCPLTFNTGNKLALGIADTQPLSLLAEALGARKRTVVVPFVNESLWQHPEWESRLKTLVNVGVRLVDPATGEPSVEPLASGTGDDVARRFDPSWVVDALRD